MITSHGVILHAFRYNDSQLIVNIYTEQAGMIPFFINRVRARKGRGVHASEWQPLSLVEVTWAATDRKALQRPAELSLWHPWRTIPFQPYKMTMALFLGEFLYYALRHEMQNPALFDYMTHSLAWLDESEEHYANFHVVFLLRLTRFLGFYPNVEHWHAGQFFDMQNATFTDQRPLHDQYIEPAEAALVPKFMRMDMRKMRAVGLNGAVRRRALELIVEFYRLHVAEFPDIKSLDILAEVFA